MSKSNERFCDKQKKIKFKENSLSVIPLDLNDLKLKDWYPQFLCTSHYNHAQGQMTPRKLEFRILIGLY